MLFARAASPYFLRRLMSSLIFVLRRAGENQPEVLRTCAGAMNARASRNIYFSMTFIQFASELSDGSGIGTKVLVKV
jgi:hypothetical protein